jgi:hypothetical protein
MATRIIEYGGSSMLGAAYPVIPSDQFVTAQSAMTATGTSAQSAALNNATGLVLVQSDEQIYVKVGNNPTAATDHYRIAAGGEQFFAVQFGQGWKVAIRT